MDCSSKEGLQGRTTSSPWPDRIEINEVERLSDDEYSIKEELWKLQALKLKAVGLLLSDLLN